MRKKGTFLILIGLVLILAAGFWFYHNKREERQAEAAASAVREQLREMMPQGSELEEADRLDTEGSKEQRSEGYQTEENRTEADKKDQRIPDYILDPNRAMPEKQIDGYGYIGYLEVPSLGMDLAVQSEWSYPGLEIAPCRYSGSAYLNNLVICGHNYFPGFINLTAVSQGDEVRFTDMDGNVFKYEVAAVEILDPEQVNEMTDSGWDLSLFTCTYSTVSRVTVRCSLIGEK